MDVLSQPSTQAYLLFSTGPLAGVTFPISATETTIGRETSNDIVISDPQISRHHARLIWENNTWQIEKLSKTSTVSIDKRRIEKALVHHNSTIQLGNVAVFRFLLMLDTKDDAVNVKTYIVPRPGQPSPVPLTPSPPHVQQPAHIVPEPSAIRLPQQAISPAASATEPSKTVIVTAKSMGLPSFEVTDNTTGSQKQYALIKETFSIGQHGSNDIVISAQGVAGFHLQLVRQNTQWVLIHPHPASQDTYSGLLYAGRTIKGNEDFKRTLTNGDTFRINDKHGALITLRYSDGSGRTNEMLPRMRTIPIEQANITLGRAANNTVALNHPQVSAYHARLVREYDTYRLIDFNSTNHTYINGLQVSNYLLQYNDEIRIGPFRIVYTNTQLTLYDESGGIRIDALGITQIRDNQAVLLNNISLSIPQSSFVALVGASGAGKSTLLDALSGLRPAQQGQLFYNGQDYYQNLAAYSTQIGYVPQDEIIHRDLTVERVLYYAARLRLPIDFTQAQIEQRVSEVLDDVEMQHRRSLLTRQLSGGQRKRVSIALELLAKPSLFFLDEPTSGLDPGLDRKIMLLLRKLADKGHTIVLVTHATNNINVCDYVCFLAPGGNMAYFGPPEEAKTYFKQPDFAEIYSVLEGGDSNRTNALELAETFRNSPLYEKHIDRPLNQRPNTNTQLLRQNQRISKDTRKGRTWQQFCILFVRYLELLKNDKANLIILLLQAPVIGLLLLALIQGAGTNAFNADTVMGCPTTAAIVAAAGFPDPPTPINPVVSTSCQRVKNFLESNPPGQTYAKSRGGVANAIEDFMKPGPGYPQTILFIMAFAAIMFGCINAIREIVKEASIYRRERTINLGIIPYMFSKIAVLGLLCLFQCLILIICVAILDPFRYSIFLPPFLEIYITISLTSLAGLMTGLMISALVSNNDRATSFIPLVLLPQVIFSGVVFPLTSWPLQLPGMLFPIRWAMAALGSSVGLHSDKMNGDQILGSSYTYHGTLFSLYSHTDAVHYLALAWLILVILIIIQGSATGYFLKRKDIRR